MGETTATVGVTGTNWTYSTSGVTFHYAAAGGSAKSVAATIQTNYASATLSGLTAGTKYTLYATCTASDGSTVKSPESTFTTLSQSATPTLGSTWLEMPAAMTGSEMGGVTTSKLFTHTFYYGSETDSNRNYTVCYDTSKFTTYWVAYPLNSSHRGSVGRNEDWSYVSSSILSESLQQNIKSGSYRSSSSGGSNNYSRGHLLPSGSRQKTVEMNKQTFLSVNLVPQIQNNFNGGVWMHLESALQDLSASDDLFVVTGTALQKATGSEEIGTMARTYDQSGKEIAVPRYFYKVVLKVNSTSNPTSASAIGFWFTNKAHTGDYDEFACSVNEIEQKLGMNFFPNLPDSIEEAAESISSWSTFKSF